MVEPSLLPEKWFCFMNIWDASASSCEAPEETADGEGEGEGEGGAAGEGEGEGDVVGDDDGMEMDDEAAAHGKVDAQVEASVAAGTDAVSTAAPRSLPLPQSATASGMMPQPQVAQQQQQSQTVAASNAHASRSRSRANNSNSNSNSNSGRSQNQTASASSGAGGGSGSGSGVVEAVNWVQCGRCDKWRKVPSHVDAEALPDDWVCAQNSWSPQLARLGCSAKEETDDDTTATRDLSNQSQHHQYQSQYQQQPQQQGHYQPQSTSAALAAAAAAAVAAKKLIQWVQCDKCKKWRKVPSSVDVSRLPSKWFCEMGWGAHNHCEAPEESAEDAQDLEETAGRSRTVPGSAGGVANAGAMLGVGKGPGALSYRRLIFGTDGRIRPHYNEKVDNSNEFS